MSYNEVMVRSDDLLGVLMEEPMLVEKGKTYRFVKRTPKRVVCIGGTDGMDMGVSRDLSCFLPIRTQEVADAILSWIRLYEPRANWALEEASSSNTR